MPSVFSEPCTAPVQLNCGLVLHAPAWAGFQPAVAGQASTTAWPASLTGASCWGGNLLLTLAMSTGAASSVPNWKRTAAMATWFSGLPDTHSPLAGTFGGGGSGAPSGWPCHQ